MGNVCSPSFSCDDTISHCLDCTVRRTRYITGLQENLLALENEWTKLMEERDDVSTRVIVAEQQQMKRLKQVQGWLTRVHDEEAKARMLIQQSDQEVEQLCLGGFCSKNCKSSYKFGKQVVNTLRVLENLRTEGDFQTVAQTAPENPVDERPIPSTVVGLEEIFEEVWRCITEEQAGIIGIHGMGGVGKTTLLNKINNKLHDTPDSFDVVIWAVVSKDLELEKIQESIAEKIGAINESWKSKSLPQKAQQIFKILSKKKFVLLLDDIWEEIDLTKVGLPPSPRNASKVIFTTRKFDVCGKMEANKRFKMECLRYEDAWDLFEKKVGREILDGHPNIPELAKTVAKECGGLPLALITVGRAMACKRTPQEWELAIEVLKSSASKFSDMEGKVFSCLKVSYDFLPDNTHRFCLLYCSLFPEDFKIRREELIDCWLCEGFLDEYDGIGARNLGTSIIGTLLHACLLEEAGDYCVKMHDVIRDMALWITSANEKEKEKFLALAGVGLTEAPRIQMWEEVTRISLMNNKITNLSKSPTCPRLQTLFLGRNDLQMIQSDFFRSMTSLCVLNLSNNPSMEHLPPGISCLVSLQHLDLSSTSIKKLPEELKNLVNLKCLNLENTMHLLTISRQLISNLKLLRVLRMLTCGVFIQEEDSILFGGGELLVEELFGLKHLNVLTITLKSFYALQRFYSSSILQRSTRSLEIVNFKDLKSLSVLSLVSLERLHLYHCLDLEELKIEYTGELKSIRETHGFHHLQEVFIGRCSKLRHMTWLIFAPNIKRIGISHCQNMEAIIKLDEVPAEVVENLIPFSRLQYLSLFDVENLQSIYPNALQFLHLKEMLVRRCPKLHKLPLDCSSASERKFIIEGEECWWNELQWDNEATRSAFLPCFKCFKSDWEFIF